MKSFVSVICFLVFINFSLSAQSQWQDYPKRSSRTENLLNKLKEQKIAVKYDSTLLDSFILATMNSYHIPGVQACIVKGDRVIWKGAYGYANIAQNRPVTDSTLFYLASVSKTVTATALMQLWEQGLFNLDDDINNYLPFSVRNPNHPNTPITFRMLLTHTSSIIDNWSVLNSVFVWGKDSPIPLDSFLVNYLVSGGSYYYSYNYNASTPSTQWEYTNAGATLIGYLVQTISHHTFEQYCQDSIFIPLGMNETSWFQANLDTTHIAMPYSYSGGSYHPYGHRGSPTFPAGQLRTSAVQLSRFLRAYIQNGQIDGVRILNSTTVDLITTKHLFVNDPTFPFWQGFIWRIFNYDIPNIGNDLYCSHLGGSQGARTGIDYVLENPEKLGSIVLSNGESDEGLFRIGDELYVYGYLLNKIYAQNVSLNSAFMQANVDTLILNTEFLNPNNHNFSSNAIIKSTNGTYEDSIALYDDGNHRDLHAGDGIWGNYIIPVSIENEFMVDISTVDLYSGEYFCLRDMSRFTTVGPVRLYDSEHPYIEVSYDPSRQRQIIQLILYNAGSTATAKNITAQINSNDLRIANLTKSLTFGDIPAGTADTSDIVSFQYLLGFNPDSTIDNPIRFELIIYSGNLPYWTDKVDYITGIDSGDETTIPYIFSLSQNYPNPFNPITSIQFSIPRTEFVTLKIYNLLGQKVATLVSEKLTPGKYTYTWDASDYASGVYLYRIEAGSFTESKKLLLLK